MTTNLKKFTTNIPLIFLLVTFFLIICQANNVISTIIDATTLFFTKLFPCMFIFYTLSDLLLNYGILNIFTKLFKSLLKNIFHLDSTSSYIIFMSILTGFPSGSKYTVDFYNKKYITTDIANYLLTFTHFSNPLFILGTISTICTKQIALIILISQYLSNFILAFLIRPKEYLSANNSIKNEQTSFINCLNNSFQNTFSIIKVVLSTTIFFVVIISIFSSLITSPFLKSILFGFFDLTKGVTEVNKLLIPNFYKGLIICTFLSFGGVSVHMQVKSIIANKKLSYSSFLKGRIAATGICLLLYIMSWHFLGN